MSPLHHPTVARRPGRAPARLTRFLVPGLAVLFAAGVARAGNADLVPVLRFGCSTRMLVDVNDNDARAAIKVWGQAIARERRIQLSIESSVWPNAAAIVDAVRTGQLDVVVLTTDEYLLASRQLAMGRVLFGISDGVTAAEYELVVRADDSIRTLADLQHRRLIVLDTPRMCLARPWLDCVLARQGLPTADRFFATIQNRQKPTAVVLPVFFRSAEACLATRHVLATMTELNPQLGKSLRVFDSSPPIVPVVVCFRAGFDPPYLSQLVAAMLEIRHSSAGQQVTMVFRFDHLEERELTCLNTARALMDEYERRRTTSPDRLETTPPGSAGADQPPPPPEPIAIPPPSPLKSTPL